MKRHALTLSLALVLLFQSVAALASDATPAEVVKDYQALIQKAPWGVGSADYRAAKDLCDAAKKAEKGANNVDFANMQRVQFVTHLVLGLEHLRVDRSKIKMGFHFGAAGKNGYDLKKAFDENPALIASVWAATKADYKDVSDKYVEAMKQAAGKLKEKLEALRQLMEDAKKG